MNVFETLSQVNVNDHTEKKNGLTYLSWAWAWNEVMKKYPEAQYEILFFDGGLPYQYDERTGYLVWTSITIEGQTRIMWLPVMDSANKAMKARPYAYTSKQWNKSTGRYEEVEKTVAPATMFDINKTIMRCLVKNLGMFGLGLYIYAGEDLPESIEDTKANAESLLIDVTNARSELESLGVDFRDDPKIKSWIVNQSGVQETDIGKMTEPMLKAILPAYTKLINAKKAQKV